MARVTATDVKAIIDTELVDATVEVYITSASTTINNALSGKGLSEDVLKEIERWMSAHMIACTKERMAIKEEAGSAKVTYTGVYGQGLKLTSYGQMVESLDTTGTLAALGEKQAFLFSVPKKS